MNQPEISVIVPVYKVEEYLDRCVESILAQTWKDFELLLIDDGSPDRCGAMCDAWAEKDSRIRALHKENGGLSDARNYGLEASCGQYVIFIDSDDFIEPEMLQILQGLTVEHGADIAVCGICNCFESGSYPQFSVVETAVYSGQEALEQTLRGQRLPGGIVTKLIRRQTMGDHRFLKGKTYEDAFITPELLLDAKVVAATTQSLYNYWHRSGSITSEAFSPKAMDVIEAYEHTLDVVRSRCPELEPMAQFRLQWAHFVVLDRMLLMENYRALPQYREVVAFLKQNWIKILRSPYFRKGRRISAAALKCHVGLYALLSKANHRKTKENS